MKKFKTSVVLLIVMFLLCNSAFAGNGLQQNSGLDHTQEGQTADVASQMTHRNSGAAENPSPTAHQSEEYALPQIDWTSLSSERPTANLSTALQNSLASDLHYDITAASQASLFNKLPLSFQVADSAFDPVKPVVYVTDSTNKKLYAVNWQTGKSASLSFQYAPESLTYANGELYVSLLISGHTYYGSTESGAVAIVDPDSLALKDQFAVNIDPYDIEADTNYIYITSGSNQWTHIRSYSRATKLEVSNASIRAWCYEKLHPTLNRLYTIDTDSSPRDFCAFNISNGLFTDDSYPGGYDSPYHGDYSMATNFSISPDGKYLFNGAGTIFNCDAPQSSDMFYKYTLDSQFSDIAFDLQNTVFYTAAANHTIAMYDYETLQRIGQSPMDETVVSLNLGSNTLAAVCKTDSNVFYIETLAAPRNAMIAVPQNSVEGATALNGTITGVVYDAARSKAYAVDRALNKLYVINPISNHVERTVVLPYSPYDLCISEDGQKLYIVNHDENVMVTELELASLTVTRNLPFHCTDCISYGNTEAEHRYIYEHDNRLYVTSAETSPGLYVFDAVSFNQVSNRALSRTGALGFSSDNDSFFCRLQDGWSSGYINPNVSKYSINADTYALADQSSLDSIFDYGLDTPVLILPTTGTVISGRNAFSMNSLKNIVYTFPENIYAVNAQETIAAGKQSIFHYDTTSGTWTPTPLVSKGTVKKLFFAGDQLMALSRTDGGSGFYFLETIWTGETHSITGKIKLGYGVTPPPGGLKVQVKAASGNYTGTTTFWMQLGELSYTLNNLPALPDYTLSYTIADSSSGKSADDDGFIAKGYYNNFFPVEDARAATLLNLTSNDVAADMPFIGNRTISGVISLPNGDTAPKGGLSLVMGVSNAYDGYLVPVIMPEGAQSIPYSLHVPSTAPNYGFNIICYQADARYLLACGYSESGTVPLKKLSSEVRVADGNRGNIDITLIQSRKISGTVSLPSGAVAKAGGLPVEVFTDNGNYHNAITVTIPGGKNAVAYDLTVPSAINATASLSMYAFGDNGSQYIHYYIFNYSALKYVSNGQVSTNYTVGYRLYADDGYQTCGYYGPNALTVSSKAATINVGSADQSAVNLTVLKGATTISGRIDLPSGVVIPVGGLDVYVVATCDQLDYNLTTSVHLSQGSSWANYSIDAPALPGYYIYYYVDDSANPGYVPYGYYANAQTTANKGAALTVDTSSASRSGINLNIAAGVAVSGNFYITAQPVDVTMVVALWNNDFEIDHTVTIAKSSDAQNVPYTVFVPAGNNYCAQYVIKSQLDGYLSQGYYPGPYSSSAGYLTSSSILTIGTAAVTNINFNLIAAGGMITGTIGMPDGSNQSAYCIYVPLGSAYYEVYYYLSPKSIATYKNIGYYATTGTTADLGAIGYAHLVSGLAAHINVTLLPADTVQIKNLTSTSADVTLEANKAGTLYVAVFSTSGKMLSIGSLPIAANAANVHIPLSNFTIPSHYVVKIFLLDEKHLPQRTVVVQTF